MLTRQQARSFYDHFGAKQDWQRIYEGQAIRALITQGNFETARSVFEFGCGTGAFAEQLLTKHLPEDATYLGCDISTTMVKLAWERLARFKARAGLQLTDGSVKLATASASFDRFVSNYVLDLLPETEIRILLDEAYRMLVPGGYICLLSLTCGVTPMSRVVESAWTWVHAQRPYLVGGCRPLELLALMSRDAWLICYSNVVSAFGIPSEVVIAQKV